MNTKETKILILTRAGNDYEHNVYVEDYTYAETYGPKTLWIKLVVRNERHAILTNKNLWAINADTNVLGIRIIDVISNYKPIYNFFCFEAIVGYKPEEIPNYRLTNIHCVVADYLNKSICLPKAMCILK